MRFRPILVLVLLAGCARTGTRTVTRSWIDCNTHGTLAWTCDRIDVQPAKPARVAEYRWRHARGPVGPWDSTLFGAIASGPYSGSSGESPEPEVAPPRELLPPLPRDASRKAIDFGNGVFTNRPRTLAEDDRPGDRADLFPEDRRAEADLEPVRSSWLFDATVTK